MRAIQAAACEFFRRSDANVALLSALLLPALLLAGGLGLDYARRGAETVRAQEASDAAIASLRARLDGVSQTAAEDKARVILAKAGYSTVAGDGISVAVDLASRTASVVVAHPMPTTFVKIVGVGSIPVNVRATAKTGASGPPICVLALNPTSSSALLGSGGSGFDATNCNIQVNSSSANAVVLTGNSTIDSAHNCFVGGVQSGLSDITPAPAPSCQSVPDPFAGMTKPMVGACTFTNYVNTGVVTLNPGVYCGGIKFTGGATVTFNPGLYIINGGKLEATGGGSLTGHGVSFFLTGANSGVTLSGGTAVDMSGMSTGLLAGFVFYLDPNATTPLAKSSFSGSANVHYEGVFYFPHQTLEVSGTGAVASPSAFLAYVADKFTYTGGSTLTVNYDEASATVPVPAGLRAAGVPYLSQ